MKRKEAKPTATRKARRSRESLFSLSAAGEFTGDRSRHTELVKTKRGKEARFAADVITSNNSLTSTPVSPLRNNQLPEQSGGEDAEQRRVAGTACHVGGLGHGNRDRQLPAGVLAAS